MFGPNDINWLCPVNWQHQLNLGLKAWWLVVPGLTGGPTWIDLTDPSNGHHGTLTNMDTAKAWKGASSPGGWGAIDNAQSDGEEIDIGGLEVPSGTDITFALWINVSSWNGTNPGLWRNRDISVGTSFNIFQGSTGRPWIRWNGTDGLKPLSGYSVSLNVWIRIVYTMKSGGRKRFYADGRLRHSADSDTATTPAMNGAGAIYNIGWQTDLTERVAGLYDDVRFVFREWSEQDVMQDYNDSRAGYPNTLNWIKRRLPVAAGGATANDWYYRQQQQVAA